MQTRKFLIAAFALAILFTLLAPSPALASASVSIGFFHDQLSPHGRWVVAGSFGNVWVPGGVAAGWSPYVNGQWVWTDFGWTWVSYDPWGDIPYHYGTWTWVSDYGWCWVPGTVWAPAWVTWAWSDNFIGWAPVPVGFVFTTGGFFGGPVVVSASRFCFVPTTQFVGVNASTVRVPVQQNSTIFARTTRSTSFQVSNGIVHSGGPQLSRIERATGHQIQRASIGSVNARPTTIAAGGVSKSRIGVVAPASQRAQELKTASARATNNTTTSNRTAVNHEGNRTTVNREARTSAATKTNPKSATAHESNRVAAKPAPKPEHHATAKSTQSTSKSTHSKPVTEEKSRAAVKSKPKASTTTAQKHVTTSSPRTAEVHHAAPAPQTHVAEKHVEKPRQVERQPQHIQEHSAVNRSQSVKPAPPKEHAPPPQQVASNRQAHSAQAASPRKEKPTKEQPRPQEQR